MMGKTFFVQGDFLENNHFQSQGKFSDQQLTPNTHTHTYIDVYILNFTKKTKVTAIKK